VLGAAGSGKTTLIGERFGWLVEQGAAPEKIAVVVPSSGRADALRARIEGALTRGYEELIVGTPLDVAVRILGASAEPPLTPGDRLAMLLQRVDELSLAHHDFGGNAAALFGRFVRRIDSLKGELISAEQFAARVAAGGASEREFAEVYRTHERMLAEAGARDAGDLIRDALGKLERTRERPFEHVMVDDGQQLRLAGLNLARAAVGKSLLIAGDPLLGGRTLAEGVPVVELGQSRRCPQRVMQVAERLLSDAPHGAVADAGQQLLSDAPHGAVADAGQRLLSDAPHPPLSDVHVRTCTPKRGGEVAFWRCANDRAQAQGVAADVERLISREGVEPGAVLVLVPHVADEGQAMAVALEERAVAHRLIGEASYFLRAEIRDLLAWLRLLADPTDAPAVVRALARPPIDLRSVDIARCTQIARRRKLDMVEALAAATESPQVPPEARERIRVFLKLYRSGMSAIDTARVDLYVHRLIERLGLRRQQLFAAQPDVVERLRALARFGELAAAYVRRAPQATPREFARSIAAVADYGLREQEEPDLYAARVVQVVPLGAASGLEAEHVYVIGLQRRELSREALYVAPSRARSRVVLCSVGGSAAPPVEAARNQLGASWEDKEEELFGPAETLQSTYRLLRDELLDQTVRTGGRLGELRLDTDLDVSHAVVRYLELLKVATLISRPEGQGMAEALRDVNARILQAVTAEQKEIFTTSALDDYLLDAERDTRRRAQVIAARDEPSLEQFLPLRGGGVVLSASDIDTYRTCPLKYKFARVFRIPQEPTVHQRFGILVHQVLERFHAAASAGEEPPGTLAELLGLLDAGWRRAGFGDSEEERQLRGKASAALTRYHERFQSSESEPVWFERPFTFRLGPHLLRGRVDRVDRLPSGEYELVDYKTGRPKTAAQLAGDVQLSLYAVGAREAWQLDCTRQAYYYLLDDEKVEVPADEGEWVQEVVREVADGILAQGFEPTPSFAACSVCDYRLVCPAAER
jgi:DNA helicase-2/ATP-dependent DNA helicase PcrA